MKNLQHAMMKLEGTLQRRRASGMAKCPTARALSCLPKRVLIHLFCVARTGLIMNSEIYLAGTQAFQIMDTLGFAAEVSRQIPGFKGGIEGSCLYRSDTMICRKIGLDTEKYKLPDGNIDKQMIADSGAALGGHERLLLKHKKYEQQHEYRFIWNVNFRTGEYVDIFCHLARQFCRKVELADYE